MSKSFKEWMAEGENLYQASLAEYQQIETQLVELEQRLLAKREELNEIARVVGKEPIDGNKRLAAEIVDRGQPNSVPNSPSTIARALTGRGFGR